MNTFNHEHFCRSLTTAFRWQDGIQVGLSDLQWVRFRSMQFRPG